LEVNPDQPMLHVTLGTLYEMKQNKDLAEQHYRKALEINSDFIPAANNLAFILVNKPDADLNEALKYAQKAKEAYPESPEVMDTLGWIYYKKDLLDSAHVELSASLEKLPDNALVNYHLGMVNLKQAQKDLARQHLEKALALDNDFEGAYEARKALVELEKNGQ
jgi:Tfp pilus assembly protein PilF